MNNNTPLVSICCITYNHENYILDALKSFVNQKTTFDYEIVVSDDGSTDNTIELIKEFKLLNNAKITIYRNQNKKGVGGNFLNSFINSKGKYIALCEGDDFWLGNDKLQKQFEFLEYNHDFSVCAHLTFKLENNTYKPLNAKFKNQFYTIEDYLIKPSIHTSSFFFDKETLLRVIPEWYTDLYSVDNFTILLLCIDSKIGIISEYKSVYRINSFSISNKYNLLYISNNYIKYLEVYNSMTKFKYNDVIKKVILQWGLRANYLLPNKERMVFLLSNLNKIFQEFKLLVAIKLIIKYLSLNVSKTK